MRTFAQPEIETLVGLFRRRFELENQQRATQAQLIRWCLMALRMDPNTNRLRGHETFADRSRIIKENRNNQKLALIYLEWLATQLEDASGHLMPSDREKEPTPCLQASDRTMTR